MRPLVLIIMDGWGINPDKENNAVALAKTPNFDRLEKKYPQTILAASGEKVGLPENFQGSSEVGHLNIGAGRIVEQEVKRVNDFLMNGSWENNKGLKKAFDNCRENNSSLHLMGLVQDEGVHAYDEHLFALLKNAKNYGLKKVYVHFFADGRDTPPRSAEIYLERLEKKMDEIGIGEIATLMGRGFAMDRGENWEVTSEAYAALTQAKGLKANSVHEAIKRSYMEDKTADGQDMYDEYIPPTIMGGFQGINDGDSVIHFNYRQDRATQLTEAFVEDYYPGEREKKVEVVYVGLTRYYDNFPHYIIDPIDEVGSMKNIFPEVISSAGLKQLRISEEQKFYHATNFINAKRERPFPGEDRIKVPSLDFRLYAQHPEMSAQEVTDETIKNLAKEKYDFILINFANGDMVGHTGNLKAAAKAVEKVDECIGRVSSKVLELDGTCLITADHGNAEEMHHTKTGQNKTSHTTNPVPFIYVASDYEKIKLKKEGCLADIAPTMLHILRKEHPDLVTPEEMTGENLIV